MNTLNQIGGFFTQESQGAGGSDSRRTIFGLRRSIAWR